MRTRSTAILAALGLIAGLVTAAAISQAADHLEAPLAAMDGRTDINDLYVFQSPEDSGSTVLIMTVNPAAGLLSPTTFDPDGDYTFKIDQDLGDPDDATADATISVDFGAPDASGVQSVTVSGAVSGVGTTGTPFELDDGGHATADLFDDPFFFDFAGFLGTVKGSVKRTSVRSRATRPASTSSPASM